MTIEELIVKQFNKYEINHDTHYIDDSREAVIDSLKPLIKQMIIEARTSKDILLLEALLKRKLTAREHLKVLKDAEQYYNETFK